MPVRVAGALMDRLAVPVTGDDLLGPLTRRTPARPAGPRSEPQNLAFADDLNGWITGGSSRAEVTGSHWDDYTVTAADGTATLAAAVPHPYGDVFLGQEFLASDYRGTTVTLRAEVRAQDVAGHGELSLHIVGKPEDPSQDRDLRPAPGPSPQPVQRVRRDSQRHRHTITGSQDWTSYEVTAPVPAHAEQVEFKTVKTTPADAEAQRGPRLRRPPGPGRGDRRGHASRAGDGGDGRRRRALRARAMPG